MTIAYQHKEDYFVIPNDRPPAGIIHCITRIIEHNIQELMLVNLNNYD